METGGDQTSSPGVCSLPPQWRHSLWLLLSWAACESLQLVLSLLHLTAGEPGLQIHTIASGFYVGSGDQAWLIALAQPEPHPLSGLPSPDLGLSNVFLINDLRTQWLSTTFMASYQTSQPQGLVLALPFGNSLIHCCYMRVAGP